MGRAETCVGDRTRHANGQGEQEKTVDNCFDEAPENFKELKERRLA